MNIKQHLSNLQLPDRYQVLLELRFFAFALCFPLLCTVQLLTVGCLIILFPITVPIAAITLRDTLKETGHGYIDYIGDHYDGFWELFTPVDKYAPIKVAGLPLGYFELAAWLSDIRTATDPYHRQSTVPRVFHQIVWDTFVERYRDEAIKLLEIARMDLSSKRLINSVVDPQFLPMVNKQLKELQQNYEQIDHSSWITKLNQQLARTQIRYFSR